VKSAAGFSFVFAIAMVLNAIQGKWAFVRSETGGKWVVLDLVIAVVLVVVAWMLWRSAKRNALREQLALERQQPGLAAKLDDVLGQRDSSE